MTRCEQCGYFWQEENEDYPSCHYTGIDAWAPCVQDDVIEEPEDFVLEEV